MAEKTGDTLKEGINCKKYRSMREYSHIQELIDNLPYTIMIVLGAIIFFICLEISILGWVAAGFYILYGVIGAFIIILFVCPYCHYYDTKGCPCGYGRIAPKLRSKKDENRFMEKFKKCIPVIIPLWIIPVLTGGVIVIFNFYWEMLVLLIVFTLNSFVILPLVSTKYGCAHCPQKDTCPWMRSKSVPSSVLYIDIGGRTEREEDL